MADIKFSCPNCGQAMEAHEQWGGEQTQCPTCKKEFAIPKPAAPPRKSSPLPTVPAPAAHSAPEPKPSYMAPPPPAPPAETKLKFAAHAVPERTAAPAPPTRFATAKNPTGAAVRSKKSGGLMKALISVVVVVIFGAGGYFGYGWFKDQQEKKKAALAPKVAVTNAPATPTPPPDAQPPLAATESVWTLDLDSAQIPEGRANGNIAGTNFVLAAAHLFVTDAARVLSLRSDTNTIPDRQLLIYLRAAPGESVAGRSWNITTNQRGAGVPLVIRSAKPAPQFAPQLRNYPGGYALKLELGALNGRVMPGRIFIALPDAEQTVVAGQFIVTTNAVPARQ
jgi:hypothetical protein